MKHIAPFLFITLLTFNQMDTFAQKCYKKWYQAEVNSALAKQIAPAIVTLDDIKKLPAPVQKYLLFTGAIGKPKVENARMAWSGEFKTDPKKPFARFKAKQHNFFSNPKRMFYMTLNMKGIPMQGFHLYKDQKAMMRIKLLSLFQVVNATGEKMDQGETVTVFNDLCLMAPSALIDANVEWKIIDSLTVKAKYTNGKNSINATLFFNDEGALINFISTDRCYSTDGKTYFSYPWSTPVKDYKEINGRKVPSYGETIWDTSEGKFCYGKFFLQEIEYNVMSL